MTSTGGERCPYEPSVETDEENSSMYPTEPRLHRTSVPDGEPNNALWMPCHFGKPAPLTPFSLDGEEPNTLAGADPYVDHERADPTWPAA